MAGRGNLRENPRKKNFGDDYVVDPEIIEPNHAVVGNSSRGKSKASAGSAKPNNAANSGPSSSKNNARVDAIPVQSDRGVSKNNSAAAGIINADEDNTRPGSNLSNERVFGTATQSDSDNNNTTRTDTNSVDDASAGNGEGDRWVDLGL